MQYWNDLITKQSWQKLAELNQQYRFVLIGGWAVYLYTKALKSRDIDVIVDFETLSQFKKDFDLSKNERLKKYEIKELNFDIDVYVEHYSHLGLPAEEIIQHAVNLDGFQVPRIEVLLILKQLVWQKRQATIKGEKDKIDIWALLNQGIDYDLYQQLLHQYQQVTLKDALLKLLADTVQVPALNLHQQRLARLKKNIVKSLGN